MVNRPGTEGNGGNSDIYFQQDRIGGYSGFGSDMVFSGTVGAPADNFGPGSISPYAAPWRHHQRELYTGDPRGTFRLLRRAPFRVFRPSAQFNVRARTGAPSRARVTPCR
jgi:hypothetical protein